MEVNLGAVIVILSTVILIYKWITRNNDYFHEKPIPSMAVKPLFGSTGPLILKQFSLHGFINHIYQKYPNAKVLGIFDALTPIFVVRDPELIKKIAVKDFDHFIDHRPMFGNSENDNPYSIFGKTLFALEGQKWRDMRATLSPAFTGSKMRKMFELVIECSDSVAQYYVKQSKKVVEVELTDMCTRFGSDVIATCAFGIKMDSLRERDNEFYDNGKKMMRFERLSVALRMFAFKFFPTLMGQMGIDIIDREQAKYFSALIMDAVRQRQTKGITRPDMIQLLIQARKGTLKHQEEKEVEEGFASVKESSIGKTNVSFNMTDNEMIAQAFVFFLAGFETVSTTLTFLIYDLVVNKDVQQRLYEEIVATNDSLQGKLLNYDTLQKMKYLDMVLSESMRIRPAAATLDRLCVRDYEVDDGQGLKFTINKGTAVWIPTQGIHMDPMYYPNPERFDPERFNDENKATIDPMTYLPFGVGPRNCIGSRFALMEIKAIVYYLLLHFSFEANRKTPIPLELRKGFTIVAAEGEVWIDMKAR
ncbi:AAEL002638-PA [Aedes aegypti]|uniref:AAEL002638-PA n=2 Tax=Aedes aegypti TaxID=7159 RepID=A0A1S4F2B9_AEDAE|nr:probable cytochrome P450 9f2 [Aedes aegypti]EAT46155.1 AAEL002638-PA [Aedes aegypti]